MELYNVLTSMDLIRQILSVNCDAICAPQVVVKQLIVRVAVAK